MNRQILLLILLTSLMGFSCKKVFDCGKPRPGKYEPYITNPTSYVLKRQIWTGPATNGTSFIYLYNSDHLVSRIEQYNWATFSSNGGPVQVWHDTVYHSFEYTNGLCTKWATEESGQKEYFLYEYNNRKLPLKCTSYSGNNSIYSYSLYKYDTRDNLVEKTEFGATGRLNFRFAFVYNDSNNLTSVTDNILWSAPQQKMKYEWSSFDNKVNFIKAVNGLPLTYVWDNSFHSYSSSAPNNYRSESYYVPVNMDQPFGSPTITSYSYEYNDAGLPVKMRYGPWLVSFEYEKYK